MLHKIKEYFQSFEKFEMFQQAHEQDCMSRQQFYKYSIAPVNRTLVSWNPGQ